MEAEHDGEDEEEDEAFARFQQKMNNLIADGQAALTSQADMEGIEDDEEELRFKRMHSGVEKSRNGWEHSSSGIGSSNLLSFGDSTPSFKSYSNNQMFNGPSSNSTQSFTSNFSNPTSSPPPEPSKTLSFASHTPTSGGAYDFSFRPTFGGDTSTSINDSLFRNPVSGQTAQQPLLRPLPLLLVDQVVDLQLQLPLLSSLAPLLQVLLDLREVAAATVLIEGLKEATQISRE